MNHKCRSGPKKCVGRGQDGPAATVKPDTVCEGCVKDLSRRLAELPTLAKALRSFIGRTPQTALQSKVSRSMAPQPPINLEVLAVLGRLEELFQRVGNVPLRDFLKWPHRRYHEWIDGRRVEQLLDGVDLALGVRFLHSRMESMAGFAPKVEPRRAPCPRCNLMVNGKSTLSTVIGSGTVVCTNSECKWVASQTDYENICLFKSEQKQ